MSTTFTYGVRNEGAAPDALIRFVTEEELQGTATILHEKLDERLRARYAKGLFQGKPEQVESMAALGFIEADTVIVAGYRPGSGTDGLRLAAAAAAKAARAAPLPPIAVRPCRSRDDTRPR